MMAHQKHREPKLFYHGINLEERLGPDHPSLINSILNVISDYFVYYRIPEELRSPNYSGAFEPNPLWVLLWGFTAVVAIVLLVFMIVWHYY